jgi:excisionase family DNA binding protein
MEQKDFYTMQEISEILGVSKRTIWSWVKSEKIKVIRFSSKIIRVNRQDLEDFMNNQKK